MENSHKQGEVSIGCTIEKTGVVDACQVDKLNGDPEFGSAALNYVSQNHYQPATRNGVPISYQKSYDISFRLNVPSQALVMPQAPPTAHGPVTATVKIRCHVEIDGRPTHCVVLSEVGGDKFSAAALKTIASARFTPATHNGTPIASDHEWNVQFRMPPPH